jgi:hypothetical protein
LEKPDLIVVVQGDEIIVRTLGFHASPFTSHSLLCGNALKPTTTSCWPTLGASTEKARELGWIV